MKTRNRKDSYKSKYDFYKKYTIFFVFGLWLYLYTFFHLNIFKYILIIPLLMLVFYCVFVYKNSSKIIGTCTRIKRKEFKKMMTNTHFLNHHNYYRPINIYKEYTYIHPFVRWVRFLIILILPVFFMKFFPEYVIIYYCAVAFYITRILYGKFSKKWKKQEKLRMKKIYSKTIFPTKVYKIKNKVFFY